MAYQVLARKYRPQFFADVIGQNHVTQTLLNALAQDRIAHGYIFSGHRGIGKTTIARILAMALQCRTPKGTAERPTPEPCGICDACTEIRAGNAMDVIEIDAATNRGIDEIRELREGARYSPARDRYKIYILDEAHQITDAAFNALLKTLEEPPAHVIFMMATTQPEDIPQTIRSRCQHFSFHAVGFQEIVAQLRSIAQKESVRVDDAALSLLAEAGDGSMRDALSIMDQAIASAPPQDGKSSLDASQIRSLMGTISNQVFENMMEAVKNHDAAAMLEQAAQWVDAGNSPQQIARQMVRFLRNCLMARVAGVKSDLLQISDEEKARAARVSEQFSEEDLTRFLNSMLRTFDDLGYRQEQRFHLEIGLLKLVHMQRLLPFEELFRQLTSGSGAAGNALSATARTASANSSPAKPATTKVERAAGVLPVEASKNASAMDASKSGPHPFEGMFAPAPKSSHQPDGTKPSQRPAPPPDPPNLQQTVSANTPSLDSNLYSTKETLPLSIARSQVAENATGNLQVLADVSADELRASICDAMVRGGHETAGSLFEAGTWDWNGSELHIRVGASKTLLELMFTAEAQRIVRSAFQQLTGCNRPVRVESDDQSPISNGKPQRNESSVRPADGAVNPNGDARPQDHPLIRHAQQLFRAEIRSVVSLRDSR
ncbi:MAG: DNA polymerase III subunit gamma/tau [Acidobacteriaceae bacterium]